MSAAIGYYLFKIIQIAWIDLLLSGDNAVVIALVCQRLPAERRRWAVVFGAAAAVVLRLVFIVAILSLLSLPWLKAIGGALVIWIAVKLLVEDPPEETVAPASSIWGAVRVIVFADALMSLDNVLAIAGAARGNLWLIVFGLALSIPLIVFGATHVMRLLERFVWLLWMGGAVLGWVAGEMAASDSGIPQSLRSLTPHAELWAGAMGAVLVVAIAGAIKPLVARSR